VAEIKDFVKFAKDTMKKYYEEGKIEHFVVSWISQSYFEGDLGRVSHLTLCEKVIHNEKDFDKWMMRIQITPKSRILWVKDGEIRDFDEVFREIMNDDIKQIALCVKMVKRYEINNGYAYLCRIFDAWGIHETIVANKEGMHEWFGIRADGMDCDLSIIKLKLFTNRNEAEKMILLKRVI